MQQPIVRTYRGPTPDAAANAYRTDAAQAQSAGYVPISHRWAEDASGHALTVAYQLRGAAPAAAEATPDAPPAPVAASEPTASSFEPAADPQLEPESGDEEPASATSVAGAVQAGGSDFAELVGIAPAGAAGATPAGTAAGTPAGERAQPPTSPLPDHPPGHDTSSPAVNRTALSAAERPAASAPMADAAVAGRREAVAGRSEALTVQVLDMHCAGEPLRIIRTGYPDVPMLPVLERRRWVAKNADHIRRAVVNEPRGHRDMYGAVLLPPYSPDVDICLLFMHNAGYSTMCGHGVIAVTTALIEEGLFPATAPVTTIRYEVPAGIVAASASVTAQPDGGHTVGGVRFTNVPAYLAARSLALRPDGVALHGRAAEAGHLAVDLAFGGAYYGIIDAAQLGLRVVPEQASLLRHAGAAITQLLRRDHTPAHPTDPDLSFVYGTIIVDLEPSTSPDGRARDAHIRNATVFADAELDRSPCGSGTSAILAQLHARGRLQQGQELSNAGITGEHFVGRIESLTRLGGEPAVVTSVAGTAYVTGYGTLVVDERDPLGEGFLLT